MKEKSTSSPRKIIAYKEYSAISIIAPLFSLVPLFTLAAALVFIENIMESTVLAVLFAAALIFEIIVFVILMKKALKAHKNKKPIIFLTGSSFIIQKKKRQIKIPLAEIIDISHRHAFLLILTPFFIHVSTKKYGTVTFITKDKKYKVKRIHKLTETTVLISTVLAKYNEYITNKSKTTS